MARFFENDGTLSAAFRQGATELTQAMYQGNAFAPNESGTPFTVSSREAYENRHGEMNQGVYDTAAPSIDDLSASASVSVEQSMEQQKEQQIEL